MAGFVVVQASRWRYIYLKNGTTKPTPHPYLQHTHTSTKGENKKKQSFTMKYSSTGIHENNLDHYPPSSKQPSYWCPTTLCRQWHQETSTLLHSVGASRKCRKSEHRHSRRQPCSLPLIPAPPIPFDPHILKFYWETFKGNMTCNFRSPGFTESHKLPALISKTFIQPWICYTNFSYIIPKFLSCFLTG